MTAEPLVVRPDLSRRTVLSKSALITFDMCQTQSWFSLHDPRPLIPNERITFGSAVDAAVEMIVAALRSGQTVPMQTVMAAADEVIARDDVAVDRDEVEKAAEDFVVQVAPHYDFAFARTQASIDITLPDLGDCGGHPDIVLRTNDVFDVKTAKRAKPEEPTVELGFYALLVETETGKPVEKVGYWTRVRVSKPYWQVLEFPVTDELRRWTRERAGAFVRAKKADTIWNAKSAKPINVSFGGGPKFPTLCSDCAYAPANGGPCALAYRGEELLA
jgi:hypothetical protein